MSKRPPKIDFDNNWKEAIENHVYEAVAFLMPDLYPEIDTTQTPVFLEQEMRNLKRKTLKGRKRIIDKLIKVWLKTGEERWLLIHIEIESSDKEGFGKRMYIYFARAYDKYDVAIVALALFVGEKIPPNHDHFRESNYGTTLAYGYNAYIVAAQNEEALLASDNIFALYILANLYSIKTKDDMERRLELKKKMFELATERNIPLEKINSLFTFVFEIMALPIKEAKKYDKFTELKFKEMTDTTFQKNRLKTQKAIVDSMSKGFYGIYASEMVELLKKKDNVLKEQYEKARRLVIRFHVKDKETPKSISDLTGLPLNEVNAIIKAYDETIDNA
jgi:hypothetical protein